jgi:small-conductance mechanosensitive channel
MAAGDFLQFFILCAVTFAAWAIAYFYPDETLSRIAFTLLVVTILYFVLRIALERGVLRTIKDAKMRYSFRKAVSVFYIVAVAAVAVRIWIDDPQSLLVAYGIIAAGIAISLQDFFKNFVGSIVIFLGAAYTVGDRIAIGKTAGDVIDIGLMSTTLMEILEWVGGDQPTGRMAIVPNGRILTEAVINYTRDYNFIWDEITVPITYKSDVSAAIDLFLGIAREETRESAVLAEREIAAAGGKYYLLQRGFEPTVFTTLTDNWVSLTLRYVTAVRERRAVRDRISRRILTGIAASDAMEVGSSTMTRSGSLSVENDRR